MLTSKAKLIDRYLNDPRFHRMVDMFHHMMITEDVQPYEVRDAAMLAELKFYETQPVKCLLENPLFREETP